MCGDIIGRQWETMRGFHKHHNLGTQWKFYLHDVPVGFDYFRNEVRCGIRRRARGLFHLHILS